MGNPQLDDWSHATEGKPDAERRSFILDLIFYEIERSYTLHGTPRWGRHEAWAHIFEELDEVKDAIFADEPYANVLKELIHTAAMCVRYIETEPRFTITEAPDDGRG